jgi:UPF0755 protein
VRIPEGATRVEIAQIMERKFGRFKMAEFMQITKKKEGYLFPDTYFFLPNVEAPEVAKVLEDNFYAHLHEIYDEVVLFEKPLDEIVIMASLLEKEAYDLETMRMISGILWKRLEIDMPLQVDAVFLYINGKNTYELTLDDLATTSPYNTYKHKGLPPGAIANPGLDAILAAVTPPETDFLFYLSDREGNTYYSRTFEQHKIYKDRYVY